MVTIGYIMKEGSAKTAVVPGPPTPVAIERIMSLDPEPTHTDSGAMPWRLAMSAARSLDVVSGYRFTPRAALVMASTTSGNGSVGHSFDASLSIDVNPNSLATSSIGLPGM